MNTFLVVMALTALAVGLIYIVHTLVYEEPPTRPSPIPHVPTYRSPYELTDEYITALDKRNEERRKRIADNKIAVEHMNHNLKNDFPFYLENLPFKVVPGPDGRFLELKDRLELIPVKYIESVIVEEQSTPFRVHSVYGDIYGGAGRVKIKMVSGSKYSLYAPHLCVDLLVGAINDVRKGY